VADEDLGAEALDLVPETAELVVVVPAAGVAQQARGTEFYS
jgi:hypothetical protein